MDLLYIVGPTVARYSCILPSIEILVLHVGIPTMIVYTNTPPVMNVKHQSSTGPQCIATGRSSRTRARRDVGAATGLIAHKAGL